MPINILKAFLGEHDVKYVIIGHSIAYTAHDTALSAHVASEDFAKTVVVKLDDAMAMVVLPSTEKLDLQLLRGVAHADLVRLASEAEFQDLFPAIEVGAMPPFGNLFGMPVYADEALAARREIAFNAGSHREVIRLAWADYQRLVEPVVAPLATHDVAVPA